MSKFPTVSLVIPVFNEAAGLQACLDSIADQTVIPDEVIVVDNNSTDGSADIAASYDFVTLIHEKTQGIIAARDRGFDAATSTILGRIDGDCILAPDWTFEVKRLFADKTVAAAAGLLETDAWYGTNRRTTFWSRMYLGLSNAYFGVQIMQGGNMALRRKIWQQIRMETQTDSRAIHEDQDISLLVASHGYRTVQSHDILAALPSGDGSGSYHEWPKLKDYIMRWIRLRDYHVQIGTFERPAVRYLPAHQLMVLCIIMALPFLVFAVTSIALDTYRRIMDFDPL